MYIPHRFSGQNCPRSLQILPGICHLQPVAQLHQTRHRLGQGNMPPAATESQGSRHTQGPSATAAWAPRVLQEDSLLRPLGCAKPETTTVFWASLQRLTVAECHNPAAHHHGGTGRGPGLVEGWWLTAWSRATAPRWLVQQVGQLSGIMEGAELATCTLLIGLTTSREHFLRIWA